MSARGSDRRWIYLRRRAELARDRGAGRRGRRRRADPERQLAGSCSSPAAPTRPAPPPALASLCGPESVSALHVNYGLRLDSDADERAARTLCAKLRIDLHVERPELGEGNMQARAREARYAAAERLRERLGAEWVATGHTRTDLAETVLYRLACSPGTRPLLGLPPRSGRRRPPAALDLPRRRPAPSPRRPALPFVDDPSNETPRFARNRIRNEVMPGARRDRARGRAKHRRDPRRAARGGRAALGARRRDARRAPAPATGRPRSPPRSCGRCSPACGAWCCASSPPARGAPRSRSAARGPPGSWASRPIPRAARSSSRGACAPSARRGGSGSRPARSRCPSRCG